MLICVLDLTLCIIDQDPFWVELPAIKLQVEWVPRYKARATLETVLTPRADFDEEASHSEEKLEPCSVAGPACLQAKAWVREPKSKKPFRAKYFWPSEELRAFCDPQWHPSTRNLKGRGMEDYKSVWPNAFCGIWFKLTLFCLQNSGSWPQLHCPPLPAQP